RGLLPRDLTWERVRIPAYIGVGLLLFIVFIIASFPYDEAFSGILAPLGLKLTYAEQHMNFPIGAVLDDVHLNAMAGGGPPLLQSPELSLAPAFGALLLGRPGVRMRADLYNGDVRASLSRSGDRILVAINASDVSIQSIRAL